MDRHRIAVRLACGAALAAVLAGCSTSEVVTDTNAAMRKAEALNEVATRPMAAADVSPVKVRNDVYVGASVYHNDHGDPLPARWERQTVTFAKANLVSFQEVANMISVVTKIPVATSSGAVAAANTAGAPAAGAVSQTPASIQRQGAAGAPAGFASAPGVSGPIPFTGGGDVGAATNALLQGRGSIGPGAAAINPLALPEEAGADLGIPGRMRVSYSGSLRGFLDLVATNFNIGWQYEDGRILFERTVTRTFEIPTLPVLSKMDFKMSSGSTTEGGSGNSAGGNAVGGQNATTETSYNPLAEIKAGLDAVVTDGTYRYNATTGQVTVIAPPQTIRRAANFIRDLNVQLSKQIAMNVKVYSVALTDGDNYSSNLNVLFQKAGQYGLSYGTGGTVPTLASATGAGNFGWAILNPNSRFAGTNGIFQALSSRGDVSVVTSASVVTINGVPVPLQVANTRGYAAQISVTQGTSGLGASAPTASIQPGSVTTGFNLHLLPKVRSDGQLLLQYGMNISELVGQDNGFDTFSSNGSSIQLPNVNQRNFIQEAILPNGSTLVLTGFEQVRANGQRSGPLNPALFPLGGSNVTNMAREILVIAITPTLLDATVAANPPGVR